MKRLPLFLFIIVASPCMMKAQSCSPGGGVTCTSNLNLWILPSGYTNWNIPTNANANAIDAASINWPKLNATTNHFTGSMIIDGTLTTTLVGNSATATALAATPTQCGGSQFVTGIAANGNANCGTPAGSGNVSNTGTPTSGQYAKWTSATIISGVSSATVLSDIGAVPTTTTVNTHALSSNVTLTPTDLDVSGAFPLTVPLYTAAEFDNGTCSTAKTIVALNGNKQKVTLTNGSTCALTFTQPSTGTTSISLKIVQSAVSTFNGGISGGKWPGGVVPTITQTSGAIDFISCYLDGTNAFCVASQDFR